MQIKYDNETKHALNCEFEKRKNEIVVERETRELMEEVFPLTEPINLLTPRFTEEDFLTTHLITNYGTNLNPYQYQYTGGNTGQSNASQSNASNSNTSNECRSNTCTNVNCSPLPSKKYEYRRDSYRRHSAHGRITSSGIFFKIREKTSKIMKKLIFKKSHFFD